MNKKEINHKESGFTLLEMLLTISIVGVTFLVITQLLQDTARKEFFASNASYMNVVMDVAVDAISDVNGFDDIYTAAIPSGVVEVALLDPSPPSVPCTVPVNNFQCGFNNIPPHPDLQRVNALNSPGFTDFSPIGPQVSVSYQILDSPGSTERTLGVLVTLQDTLPERDLRQAAQALGAGGGYISTIPAGGPCTFGCPSTIRSAYGTWELDVTQFVTAATPWGNDVNNWQILPPTPADGGFLVAFRYYSESEVAGDYLYRVPVNGNPQLNTMNVPINMGGNSLVGVDNIDIAGDLSVDGYIHAQGSVFASGNFISRGGEVFLENGLNMQAGALTVGSAYTDDSRIATPKSINISNNMQTGSAIIQDNLTVAGNGTLGQVQASAIRSPDTFVQDLDSTDPTSAGVFTTNTFVDDMNIANQLETGEVQANGVNVTGTTGALNVITSGTATLNNVTTDTANFNQGVIINRLEQCLTGC